MAETMFPVGTKSQSAVRNKLCRPWVTRTGQRQDPSHQGRSAQYPSRRESMREISDVGSRGAMHLGVTFTAAVPGRAGYRKRRGIDHRGALEQQLFGRERGVGGSQQLQAQPVPLQQTGACGAINDTSSAHGAPCCRPTDCSGSSRQSEPCLRQSRAPSPKSKPPVVTQERR